MCQHKVFRGIPGVHQHGMARQPFLMDHIGEHLPRTVQLGVAIAVGIIDAVINQPELIGLRTDVDPGHHANALDHGFGVAAPLPAYTSIRRELLLVQHRIIEEQVACGGVGAISPRTLSQINRGVIRSPRRQRLIASWLRASQ